MKAGKAIVVLAYVWEYRTSSEAGIERLSLELWFKYTGRSAEPAAARLFLTGSTLFFQAQRG